MHRNASKKKNCAEVLFQAKFLLVLLLSTLPAEPEFNALVVVWSGGCDTAQTERILNKTRDHSTPFVRGSFSARVPRFSLAEVHRNLSTTSSKSKLMARRKDRTTGEKMDSKERKVEKSKRIKHTT